MQRTYELMFIVRPDMPEEDQDKLISNLEAQVGTAGGTVKSLERMGKRRLAYAAEIARRLLAGETGAFREAIGIGKVSSASRDDIHSLQRSLHLFRQNECPLV